MPDSDHLQGEETQFREVKGLFHAGMRTSSAQVIVGTATPSALAAHSRLQMLGASAE